MGMSGVFFAILLLIKVIWDVGPFKRPCRRGGCCFKCVDTCCPFMRTCKTTCKRNNGCNGTESSNAHEAPEATKVLTTGDSKDKLGDRISPEASQFPDSQATADHGANSPKGNLDPAAALPSTEVMESTDDKPKPAIIPEVEVKGTATDHSTDGSIEVV